VISNLPGMKIKPGSMGRAVPGITAVVVDPKSYEPVRNAGTVGLIALKPGWPSMMREIWGDPQRYKNYFVNGWFVSGDAAYKDEDGYFFIVDRKKDMIISGGENIYPREIEVVLQTHPKIKEVTVFGIPDPKWGESVCAGVVLKEDATLTEEEVISYCKQNLASYKKPQSVDFMDALPRNAMGKVMKIELREKYGKSVKY
jgi:acyl-coenzyme A synthetase/AMP-(fatty) acid ligase